MVVSIPDIKMTGLCVKKTVLGTNKSNALKNKWLEDCLVYTVVIHLLVVGFVLVFPESTFVSSQIAM